MASAETCYCRVANRFVDAVAEVPSVTQGIANVVHWVAEHLGTLSSLGEIAAILTARLSPATLAAIAFDLDASCERTLAPPCDSLLPAVIVLPVSSFRRTSPLIDILPPELMMHVL